MADPLDTLGLSLPYDYSKGEAPGVTAPPSPSVATPAPSTSHPELDDIPVPYSASEQPGGAPVTTAAPQTAGQTASKWTDWLLGQDQGPVELKPRSLSQVGSDISDFGRVLGNKAGVPGSLDLISDALNNTDLPTEQAKTAKARENIGPVAAGIADFMGQRASVLRATPWADNPIAQGVVTGGGGTLLQGGNWKDALVNAAADTGLSAAGEAIGTAASGAAKAITDRSKQVVSNAASAGLEDLKSLAKRGGDVAGAAEQYAQTARGAARQAYQDIATAANQSIEAGPLQRLGAGILGKVSGAGGLATAYIADPAIKAYNQFSKGLDVKHAIDSSYPVIAGAVKTAVDPDAWRSALQNLAISQGPTRPGSFDAAVRSGPVSWAKSLWP